MVLGYDKGDGKYGCCSVSILLVMDDGLGGYFLTP